MITIIDYGQGNTTALLTSYKRLNFSVKIAKTTEDLEEATRFILPGVGAFDDVVCGLQESGMQTSLTEKVMNQKLPVLGICIGMHVFANSSEEGTRAGLGWINGKVKSLRTLSLTYREPLPHMGWNLVNFVHSNQLFKGLSREARFYFLHEFYFACDDGAHIVAKSEYGTEFPCVVNKKNIYGVQFHPEKSHQDGLMLLKNFAEL